MVHHHHRLAPALALALTLAAAAPAAARPALTEPATTTPPSSGTQSANLCSEVCGTGGYTAHTGATLAHDPRPRLVALAGDSTGGAALAHDPRPRSVALAGASTASSGTAALRSEVVSGRGYVNPGAPVNVIRVVHPSPSGGFDWGDAGIGAAGALALILLLGGGALGALSIRRRAQGGPEARLDEPAGVAQLTR
jgi:hypothetical protein